MISLYILGGYALLEQTIYLMIICHVTITWDTLDSITRADFVCVSKFASQHI